MEFAEYPELADRTSEYCFDMEVETMHFGPFEVQACGENNFTMKSLGLLAFRSDLRKRLIEKLTCSGDVVGEDVSMLFFSRIGENFFREAIDRESKTEQGELEARFNAALGLPANFRWCRNQDGRLTQPAKWKRSHIDDMLKMNGKVDDHDLHHRLSYLQDCLNTEPDIVLQWGRRLALVEIKVLSSEGKMQTDRQMCLGTFLCNLLGWDAPLFFMIGPAHGTKPTSPNCKFISWTTVADWFTDVPEIVNYIQSFCFSYQGHWQSMTSTLIIGSPNMTAYDLMFQKSRSNSSNSSVVEPKSLDIDYYAQGKNQKTVVDAWHFSHLGHQYFVKIFQGCKDNMVWPLRWIWLGTTGVPFAEKAKGRKVNPNWMVEDEKGQRRTNSGGFGKEGRYAEKNMRRFSYDEIVQHINVQS